MSTISSSMIAHLLGEAVVLALDRRDLVVQLVHLAGQDLRPLHQRPLLDDEERLLVGEEGLEIRVLQLVRLDGKIELRRLLLERLQPEPLRLVAIVPGAAALRSWRAPGSAPGASARRPPRRGRPP